MIGGFPQLPLCAFMTWTVTALHLPNIYVRLDGTQSGKCPDLYQDHIGSVRGSRRNNLVNK
jgi:hypothetical protein